MSQITIHDILAQFRDEELHNRHLGDRFERLMCRYLELDPIFADQFSNVWMWNEWPQKGNVGDIGIDTVAEERATGEFCGIQCKFYLPEHTLSKDDIDSYLNALGNKRFTSGIIVSTTDKWGSIVKNSSPTATSPSAASASRISMTAPSTGPASLSKTRRPSAFAPRKNSAPTRPPPRPMSPPAYPKPTAASSSWPAAPGKPSHPSAPPRKSPTQKAAGQKQDKTTILYNSHLTLDGIPLEAYDYIVNGKPALEWIMERYQFSRDPASDITNDPDDWCREHNNPRYIVDLIKRVTRVSLETMKIVNPLPALNER